MEKYQTEWSMNLGEYYFLTRLGLSELFFESYYIHVCMAEKKSRLKNSLLLI